VLTADKRNRYFSVSCSLFFPIFVYGNGENSVANSATASVSQTLVASNFDTSENTNVSGFFDDDLKSFA